MGRNWAKLPDFYQQNQHITPQNNFAKKSSNNTIHTKLKDNKPSEESILLLAGGFLCKYIDKNLQIFYPMSLGIFA